MKKARWFMLFVLMATLALLLLAGCEKEENILSVSLKDHDPDSVIEIAVGGFDYSAYTLVVTYDSGDTEEVTLTEEMIAAADLVKLYQVGEHDITVSYGKQQCAFKVSVKRSVFEDLSFPENTVFVYDGKEHTVEVQGYVPANAVVTYPGGNSFVNAGTYDVVAIVSCDGYVTARLATTVKIERARYDMSAVRFDAKEFVYDGNAHALAISGTLPEGVTAPTYTVDGKAGAGATDVGEYTVRAAFAHNDPNYEAIPYMEATLKITPAGYTVKDVDIVFKAADGKVIDGAAKVYDGTVVTFDLNDYSKLSKKLSVTFGVYDKAGNEISLSNKNTNIKNAGVYVVKAEFTLADGKNYQPIAPIVREFEVLKADYPALDGVQFESGQVLYDGETHSICITGELPEGVTVSYEYYLNGRRVEDGNGAPVEAVINAGYYTVKAVFTHTDANRKEIKALSAALNIEKVKVDASALGLSVPSSVEYNVDPYDPRLITWKEITGSAYDVLRYGAMKYYVYDSNLDQYVEMPEGARPTEIGLYRLVITLSVADNYKGNYALKSGEESQTLSFSLEIRKAEVKLPSIVFTSSAETTYNGNEQLISYQGAESTALFTVSTAYFQYVEDKYDEMTNGAIPTNAGTYKFVVTVALKDTAHYVFTNGATSAVYTFEFVINKIVVDIDEMGFNGRAFQRSECEAVRYTDIVYAVRIPEGNFETISGEPQESGEYKCQIVAYLDDKTNYEFSNGATTYTYYGTFQIT